MRKNRTYHLAELLYKLVKSVVSKTQGGLYIYTMQEIRKMLQEIKEDTQFFKQFMERYHIPMQEEVKREAEIKEETNHREKVNEIEPKL